MSDIATSRKDQLAAILVRDEAARPEMVSLVADMLLDRLRWPDGWGAAIVLGIDGQPATDVTVADLVAQTRKALPECFAGGPTTAKLVPQTHTARAIALDAARKSGQSKATDDAPNPFLPATRNLTRQVLLEARDPERAARLKAEAGA